MEDIGFLDDEQDIILDAERHARDGAEGVVGRGGPKEPLLVVGEEIDESDVWADGPPLADVPIGIGKLPSLGTHQVGHDDRRGPALAGRAMDEHLAVALAHLLEKLERLRKVKHDVLLELVRNRQLHVGEALLEAMPLALVRHVKDVRDPERVEQAHVVGVRLAAEEEERLNLSRRVRRRRATGGAVFPPMLMRAHYGQRV